MRKSKIDNKTIFVDYDAPIIQESAYTRAFHPNRISPEYVESLQREIIELHAEVEAKNQRILAAEKCMVEQRHTVEAYQLRYDHDKATILNLQEREKAAEQRTSVLTQEYENLKKEKTKVEERNKNQYKSLQTHSRFMSNLMTLFDIHDLKLLLEPDDLFEKIESIVKQMRFEKSHSGISAAVKERELLERLCRVLGEPIHFASMQHIQYLLGRVVDLIMFRNKIVNISSEYQTKK